jgi:uncharacterized membrane protein YphA (DoxX/SURF4 family)
VDRTARLGAEVWRMTVVLWVLQILLALVFTGSGLVKLNQNRDQLLANPNMAWVEDVPQPLVKTIGALEVLAALGLIVPPLLDIAPVLTPLAATGLALIMVGAIILHTRRRERQIIVLNVLLLVLAAIVAWGRFGPWSF